MNATSLRLAAVLLATLTLHPGAALAGPVTLPGTSPFVAGTPIRAADVNAAFTAVKSAVDDNASRVGALETFGNDVATRLAALEAALAARQSVHAVQSNLDANASVDDTWVDVPGALVQLTLLAPTTLRYQAFARVYNYGAAAGTTTACSVRLVQDLADTPVNPVFPATMGDWTSTLVGGDGTPGNDKQLALGGLVTLPAGDYSFKLQIVRRTKGTENSGNCSIFRWPFSRAHLFLDVVP